MFRNLSSNLYRTPVHIRRLHMTTAAFSHLFVDEGQSNAYAEYRPSYGSDCPAVYEKLLTGLPSSSLAIDIATGTGQAVGPLARYFKRVIGEAASMHHVPGRRGTTTDDTP